MYFIAQDFNPGNTKLLSFEIQRIGAYQWIKIHRFSLSSLRLLSIMGKLEFIHDSNSSGVATDHFVAQDFNPGMAVFPSFEIQRIGTYQGIKSTDLNVEPPALCFHG